MTSNPDVPPFIGYVETTINALRLIHAARQGVIPRITRRLNDAERRSMIKSGAVFVFSVEESGIKRWTDGLLWSPSRIVGNFLVYREINERTSSRAGHRKPYPNDEARALVRRNSPDSLSAAYKSQLAGTHGGNDQGTFKPNGLIKKTITVTIEGSDLHLISYYTSEDIRSGKLKRPTSRPDIMALPMPPQIFRLTNFRVPPKVEIGPDGKARLVCEPEDLEPAECKTEETNYHVSDTSAWPANHQIVQPSPVENQYGSSSLYPVSQNPQMVSGMYNRVNHGDRWSLPADNGMRLANMSRHHHDVSWPSNAHAHHITRRRDSSILSQTSDSSWTSLHSQTNRWQSDGHEPTANSLYLDRSRVRSNSAYEASSAVSQHSRREGDMMAPSLGSRYLNGHVAAAAGHRDGALPRLSWLSQESSEMSRDGRHHSSSSFTPSPTIPFSHNYHAVQHSYGSTYDSTGILSTPTMQSTSPQSDLPPYDNSYASGSGAMSSPEEYTKLEEFGDSKLT